VSTVDNQNPATCGGSIKITSLPRSISRHIDFNKQLILIKSFDIYDYSDKTNPLVLEMDKLLSENSTCFKEYYQQSGPCSNWGYNVLRYETDEELSARIEKEASELPAILKKRKNDLKKAKKKFPIKLDYVIDPNHGEIGTTEIFNK
jgi:hypothetical protein